MIDFDELIHRQVESDTLDYKAHQSWSAMNAAARGKFIRHLAAFANTGGGCLVVGVGEDASGCPCDYTGLSEEEAHSFDPSSVGAYINRCVEPPIDFSLERPLVRGKRYAVFVVRPFKVLPHVCTRSVENELQTGVFYIRTPDASSRPAHRALEMHRLIQRALRNQRALLAKMLRGILYETRSIVEPSDDQSGQVEYAADDAFASLLAYFRRRRSPRPGEPGVLMQFSVAFPEASSFSSDRVKAAGHAAAGDFVSEAELKRINPGNVSWRYLSPDSPRMFQLFNQGWFYLVEYAPAAGAELPVSYLAERLFGFCSFVEGYYRELGISEVPLELTVEADGLSGVTVRSGESIFISRIPRLQSKLSRSAADIGRDVRGYAFRMLRSFGEGLGLSDSVLEAEGKCLTRFLEERMR